MSLILEYTLTNNPGHDGNALSCVIIVSWHPPPLTPLDNLLQINRITLKPRVSNFVF